MSDNKTLRSSLGLGTYSAPWTANNNLIVVMPTAPVPKGMHWIIKQATARAAVAAGGLPGADVITTGIFLIPNGTSQQFANFSTGAAVSPVVTFDGEAPIMLPTTNLFLGTTWQALAAGFFGFAMVLAPGDVVVPGGWTIAAVFDFSGVVVSSGVGFLDIQYNIEPDC